MIARQLYTLAATLEGTLICYCYTSCKPEGGSRREHLGVGWSVLEVTYARAVELLLEGALQNCDRRIPRIPRTEEDVENAIIIRYQKNEIGAFSMMRGRLSQATTIVMELGLTRDIHRQAPSCLEDRRVLQVVPCTIVCATRFKYYEAGDLLTTSCARCGEEDSFHHLVKCADMTLPGPSADPTPIFW